MPRVPRFPDDGFVRNVNHVPIRTRFWRKVHKTEKCWIWTGAKGGGGYGVIWLNGRNYPAHKLAWEVYQGSVPDGLMVCHNCLDGDNPACVNPAHLFLETHTENLRDASKKGMLASAKDGSKNPMSHLTEQDVLEIRARYVKGSRRGPNGSWALAQEFNTSQGWILAIINREVWTHT
jgi:HNH endonuclease